MSFTQARKERDDLSLFEELTRQAANMESQATVFVNTASNLHASVTQDRKDEIVALRDAHIANLRAIFGL